MAGVNKVIVIGNLGRDPEEVAGGKGCRLSIATSRSYTPKDGGERVEETEWHRITVWGKQAESCMRYLSKGRQAYVEGRLQTRKYDDKDGNTKYSTEIVAEAVQFLGGKGDAPARGDDSGGDHPSYAPSDPADDDIPF